MIIFFDPLRSNCSLFSEDAGLPASNALLFFLV